MYIEKFFLKEEENMSSLIRIFFQNYYILNNRNFTHIYNSLYLTT